MGSSLINVINTTTATNPEVPPFLNETGEGQSSELKHFLSSLPTEKGCMVQLYQYQGFWHAAPLLQGILNCQANFKPQPTDLFVVTTPKSGTTWLKALAFAIVNRQRYPPPHYNPINKHIESHHPLLVKNPHELVPILEFMYMESQLPDFSCFDSPRLFSTHLPFTSLPESISASKCKIVYLCRDLKDTLISFWFFANKISAKAIVEPITLENMFERFCKGVSMYGPFWDHVLGYWKESLENPERVCFLKYEDMKREPMVQLRRLAEFMGCPFSLEEENNNDQGRVLEEILRLCSFDHLSNLEVNKTGKLSLGLANNGFFRRGVVGDWMNHLTPEMIQKLDQITEDKLQGSGLKF